MSTRTRKRRGDGDGEGDGDDDLQQGDGDGKSSSAAERDAAAAAVPGFDELLAYLRRARGFDFANYKRAGLARRFEKRMQMLAVKDYDAYLDYLEVHPDEFAHLFNTILINVTDFFRDPGVWQYLAETIVPDILKRRGPHDPIRIWSAGCASGEEAYSLAMLFAEAMGADAFCERVKIYATDVDEDALAQARAATYDARQVAGVSRERLDRFFDPVNGRYVFNKELRRCVIFGRHDLFEDAPISKVDLITCRNALMYFNAEAQGRILSRFHFALADHGYLLLGKAEMLLTHANLFQPLDLRRRVFTKVPNADVRDRLIALAQGRSPRGNVGPGLDGDGDGTGDGTIGPERLRHIAFDRGPVAQIVTDINGVVVAINERGRSLFNLGQRDVGRLLQDLQMSYQPIELRSIIDQAVADRRPIANRQVEWTMPPNERVFLDLTVTPLPDHADLLGVLITFADVTRHRRLSEELTAAHNALSDSQEELQSTTEELETTNEEMQSTVEELETTNEELHSTNEELETMNEELQSTNEALHTINDELRQRSDELAHVNGFLEAIMTSLRTAVVVIDTDLRVVAWNGRAEDLWGLRADEVKGRHFMNLDIGLPVERLRQQIRGCLSENAGEGELTVEARNRRGRDIACKVTCAPLGANGTPLRGAILLMEEVARDGKP